MREDRKDKLPFQHIVGEEAASAAWGQQQAAALELLRVHGTPFIVVALGPDDETNFIAALSLAQHECVAFLMDTIDGCAHLINRYEEEA